MEKKSVKTVVKKAGKTASGLINKAHDSVAHALDANGDGKFDFNDVKQAAGNVGGAAQKAAASVKGNIDVNKKKLEEKVKNAKYASDIKALRPIFKDDLDSAEFSLPKLLMLVDEPDKAHKESDACKGSIGFTNKVEKKDVLTIYKDESNALGVEFYPDENGEIYYVDPADRDHYISLDDYFGYLKTARLQELQMVAQDLGAKYFNVEYWEEETVTQTIGVKPEVTVKPNKKKIRNKNQDGQDKINSISVENGFEITKSNADAIKVIAQMEFLGGHPTRPELHYLAKEKELLGLIDQRMDENNKLLSKSVTIELRKSSGLSMKDSLMIGGIIKSLKCTAGINFVNDAEKEFRSKFKYNIKF